MTVCDPSGAGVSIVFENVSVSLGQVTILQGVSAHIPAGSQSAIVGPNGAGKSTLLKAILGEIPYTGKIRLESTSGEPVRIGYVPQRLQFDRNLPLKVSEFLALPLQRRALWMGISKQTKEKSMNFLEMVHSEHLANRFLGMLSGGELQRVLLAAALIQKPNLLILDEPATGVDVQGEEILCELLGSICSQMKLTQLMVSHDLATVLHHASHVVCLNKSVVAEGSPRDVLTRETLLSLFGIHRNLVDANKLPQEVAQVTCAHPGEAHAHS